MEDDRSRQAPEEVPEGDPTRRDLLAMGAAAGVVGALIGVPSLALFAAPVLEEKGDSELWVPTGISAESVREHPVAATYQYPQTEGWYAATRQRRVVAMQRDDGFVAVDTTCTHLGCGVKWVEEAKQFQCPCHGGVFDAQGAPVAGPVSQPLKTLQARVNSQGELEVREA
ncbi:MAG: ubiquinol-cytochrome c reductase iron-sulfur subunit [Armatimonadota bacterium]